MGGELVQGWGKVTERDEKGRPVHYGRELGPNLKVVTFVIPVDEPGEATGNGGTATDGHSHKGTLDNGGHAHEADSKQADSKKADTKRDGGAKAKKDQDRRSKRGW